MATVIVMILPTQIRHPFLDIIRGWLSVNRQYLYKQDATSHCTSVIIPEQGNASVYTSFSCSSLTTNL